MMEQQGRLLPAVVHLHSVAESCLLLPNGIVTGIAPLCLTRWTLRPFGCATTRDVVGYDLQLDRGALWLALCLLSYDSWWCRRAT